MRSALLLALGLLPGGAVRHGTRAAASANPIRKVVTMLQGMQTKVQEEGKAEKEMYDRFMCYCKTGGGDLGSSISTAEAKVPAVSSNIDGAQGRHSQLKSGLKEAQVDRSSAKDAMAAAAALREKEAAAFASEKSDYEANMAAINKAVASLENGMAGAFLQTTSAQMLKRLALSGQEMLDGDRQTLMSFLSTRHGSGYAPQSGEITGILKQMGDTMAKHLADATGAEEGSITSFDDLMAAKTKEVAALTASVETKTEQIGELGVDIVRMKDDLSETQSALMEDQQFLAGLQKSCATKTAEWEERSTTRADELVALADTMKVLNDDDALELFKKTLPSASASFVQVDVSEATMRQRALAAVRGAQKAAVSGARPGLDFLVLALTGKKALSQGSFEKVASMCDNMVQVLKKEQQDDDHKKEYCSSQLDRSDDKKKALERSVADLSTAIADAKEGIETSTSEMASLEEGIKALDKSVAEATETRKEENAEFKELMASNSAAKELMGYAKNRLNKFYNPKLYKPPAKAELSAEDRTVVNMGGDAPPTTAPGGIAGTGIAVLTEMSTKDAPAPPPETWDAYAKKSEQNTGVIAMMDLLIKDLDKEMTEAETSEKDSQADYEEMMKDSAAKRTADSKALAEKESAKADMEAALGAHNKAKKDTTEELMATMKYIQSVHSECDWLVQYYDVRKEARVGEIDSLVKAKAVLSGADYSFVQTGSRSFLRRSQ